MKRVIIAGSLVFVTFLTVAQSWNPYVCQGIISPLIHKEFKGTGEASFKVGNSGSSPILYDRNDPGKNLSLVVTFSGGVPDKNNPLASLGGTWANRFEWLYDASSNTFSGIQKKDIPGYDQGTITLGYEVSENSALTALSNGFKIAVFVPSYMKSYNTVQDDMVSSYTFTRASDYGDAPASYGEARHEIDLSKDPETGFYTRFIILGSLIDQESEESSSFVANKDDVNGIDDEDGVTFPPLTAGSTVTIPVVVTSFGESFGILNGWFDWNGDGDFTDPGEIITTTPVVVFTSGTYNLQVYIPENAITGRPTFARFRIGNNSGPEDDNDWGEAEDYEVHIQKQGATVVTLDKGNIYGKVIVRPKETEVAVSVFPNPVTEDYYVSVSREGKYFLELMNDLGDIVFTKQVDIVPGDGAVRLSRGKLVSGAYFLRVTGGNLNAPHVVSLIMVQQK